MWCNLFCNNPLDFTPLFLLSVMRGHTTLSGRSWLCCIWWSRSWSTSTVNHWRILLMREGICISDFFYCRWYSMFLLCCLTSCLLSLIWISWCQNRMCCVLHLTWLFFLSYLLSWRSKARGVVTFVKFVFCRKKKSHLRYDIYRFNYVSERFESNVRWVHGSYRYV